MHLLPIYISSFVKYLFKYFASCGKEDVFLLSHKSYLYITDTKPLSCIYVCVCVCLPYYFLYGVFQREVVNFVNAQFINPSFLMNQFIFLNEFLLTMKI